MITEDEFLEQCYIFGVLFNTSPPPPGFVSLQIAYDGGGDILLQDGFPINVTDSAALISMNLDPGSRKMYTDYNIEARGGITSHILNQPIAGNVIVSQNELDRVNVNATSNDYGLTFPAGDSFPNGSELAAVQEASGGSVTLKFPTGVFLNGIDNTTFVINQPYQNVIVRRISSANWMIIYESPGLLDLQNAYDQSLTKQIVMDSTGLNFMTGANNTFLINQSGNTSYANFNILYGNFSSELDSNQEIHQALKNSSVPADSPTYSYIYNGVNDGNTTPATPFLKIDLGYHCKTAGLESGFYKLTLKSEGNQYNLFGFQGSFDPTSDPKQAQVIAWISDSVDQFLVGTTTSQNYVSVLDVFSPGNNQGSRPIPRLTDTQINSIDTSSLDQTFPLALMAYNTTYDIINYLASDTSFKTMVIKEKLVPGSNVSIDASNPDGSVIISASGGGPGITPDFGSFVVTNNTTSGGVATSFVPIVVGVAFSSKPSSSFNPQLMTISGVPTPILLYAGTTSQSFMVDATASFLIQSVTQNIYYMKMYVRKSDGTIVDTGFQNAMNLKNLDDYKEISINGIVQLNPGDGVFFQNALSNGGNVNITYMTAKIANNSGSIANTNGLPQGSSNLFLSQDGGTTYQFMSGSATVGNLSKFNTTGGGLIDSGINASNVVLTTNVNSNTFTPTFTAVAGISGTPSLISATYSKNGSIVTYFVQGTFVATDSVATLGITPPIASAFSLSSQSIGMGILKDTSSPTAFDGVINTVTADTTNSRLQANMIITVGSGTKNFTISGQYQII